MLLLLFMLLPWFTLLLWFMLLSTLPPFTVELDKYPTSLCRSPTRASTGPPPSPRPSEPPSPPSTILPAPSMELTAGRDLLLLDTELFLVKKLHQQRMSTTTTDNFTDFLMNQIDENDNSNF